VFEGVLLLSLFVAAPQEPPQDPDPRLRREARAAAFRYEALLRRRAPRTLGGGGGGECDEIIGRFCFRFGDSERPDPPPHPDHPDVVRARREAIVTHRRWLSAEPDEAEAAGALIRYLVDADQASEAVPLARTHAWAAGRTPSALLLLGLALHQAGDFVAAEAVFDTVRQAIDEDERRRLDDVRVLLEPGERRAYGRLTPEERERYNRRFWAFSDPSLQVPGNERRSAHYARHAWAVVMEEAPFASGRVSWGSDQEEILLRYGLPTSRERIQQPLWRLSTDLSMIESFDPHAVSFVPPALRTEGLPGPPLPGTRGSLRRDTVRSAYAPVRQHRTLEMTVQATRLPRSGGALLRVDAAVPPDTLEPAVPVRPTAVLAVFDTLGAELVRRRLDVVPGAGPGTVVRGAAPVPSGAWVYRVEVVDDSTDLAGLAQYRLDVPPETSPSLSDLLMSPVPEGDPLPGDIAALAPYPGATIPRSPLLIRVEAAGLQRGDGLARYAVEWWMESAERPSLLGRAARWVGRSLGLLSGEEPVRVRWEDSSADDPVVVSFSVDVTAVEPGLHRLGFTIRDRLSGREATSTRLLRVLPAAVEGPGPGRP
jgi:GWxTD domain-containing protein